MGLNKSHNWLINETKNFAELNSDWQIKEEFPALRNADILAVDCETRDPGLIEYGPGWTRNEGHLAGISIAAVFGQEVFSNYYPIGHIVHGKDSNMNKNQVISWLQKELKYNNPKVFANASYDLGWLSTENIQVNGLIEDVQIMAPLIDENMWSYSLDTLGKYYLNESKNEDLLNKAIKHYGLKNPKAEMHKLESQFVGKYAEQDAVLTLKLYNHFNPLIDKDPLSGKSLRQVYELETKLIPILFKMQQRGIRVDISKAEQVREEFIKQIKEKQKWLNSQAGFELNVNSGDDLGRACDKMGITYLRTTKTNKPSFTKEFMEQHSSNFVRTIRETRKMLKAQSTFIEGAILDKVYNGRIYPQFHQLRREEDHISGIKGTGYGRFSCSGPNIQQISARDETIAPLIKSMFLPEEGTLWGSFDWKAQEPRWTVHKAVQLYRANTPTYWLDHLGTAEAALQKYLNNPTTDYHQMVADLASISRKNAKTINLGIAYGMGGARLCKDLGLPTEYRKMFGKMIEMAGPEGQELLDKYHKNAAFIKGLSKFCDKFAQDNGYIRTHYGRHARFNKWVSSDFDTARKITPKSFEDMRAAIKDPENPLYGHGMARANTYVAMNRLIQGSSADQTKQAMIDVYEVNYLPLACIHDELAVPINIGNKNKESKEIKEIMENCIPLLIPMQIDVGLGETWGSAKV